MKESIQWMWMVLSPPVILLGTIGNVLSIIVCSRKKMQQYSFSVCLIVLSVVDTCVLHVGLIRWWLLTTFDIEIRALSSSVCKGQLFLLYFVADISFWTLCVVTGQRFVSVWFPTRANRLCTKRSSLISEAVVLILAIVKDGHFLLTHWSSGKTHLTTFGGCFPVDEDYKAFLATSWQIIDYVFAALVPFVIIAVCNGMIVYKILHNRHKVKPGNETNDAQARKLNSMNIMLTVNSFVFMILVMPLYITVISLYLISEERKELTEDVFGVVLFIWYCNSAVNFFMYCLGGPMFRHELKQLCGAHAQVADNSAAPNSQATY